MSPHVCASNLSHREPSRRSVSNVWDAHFTQHDSTCTIRGADLRRYRLGTLGSWTMRHARPGRSGLTPPSSRSNFSAAGLELYRACEVVDLHVETFVWARILGYDLTRLHGPGPTGARWFGQADLPRLRAAGLSGVVLSIATNPARRPGTRTATL